MVETASYEAVLHELRGKEEDGLSSWELFHSFTRQTRNRMRHFFPFTLGPDFIVFGLLRLIFRSKFFFFFFYDMPWMDVHTDTHREKTMHV